MKKKLQQIDELFKDALQNLDEAPTKQVWTNINDALNETETKKIIFTNKLLKYSLVASLFLFISALGYIFFSKPTTNNNQNTTAKNKTSAPINNNTIKPVIVEPDILKGDEKRKHFIENKSHKEIEIEKITKLPIKQNNQTTESQPQIKSKNLLIVKKEIIKNNINTTNNIEKQKPKIENEATNFVDRKELVYNNKQAELKSNEFIKTNTLKLLYQLEKEDEKRILIPLPIFTKYKFALANLGNKKNEIKNKRVAKNKFSLTSYIEPNFSFNKFKAETRSHNGRNNRPQEDFNKFKAEDRDNKAFSAGILLGIKLNKFIDIQSGLGYFKQTNIVGAKKVFAQNNNGKIEYLHTGGFGKAYIKPGPTNTVMLGDSAQAAETKYELKSINLPLLLSYTITKGKFNISPTIGLTYNRVIKNKAENNGIYTTTTNNNTKQVAKILDHSKNNFFSYFGVGLNYNINKNISILVVPNYQFALNKISTNSDVRSYPNVIGLRTGIKYSF